MKCPSLCRIAFFLALFATGACTTARHARATPPAASVEAVSVPTVTPTTVAPASVHSTADRSVDRSELCLSAGKLASRTALLHTESGGMRAVVAGDTSTEAELVLTYRGPSAEKTPLGNGELRRQIGLKLRAKDTCNVVYVMWHVEPTPGVSVSVKRNVGESTHAACTDAGYLNLKPQQSHPVRPLEPNERRVLRASIEGRTLRVQVDGADVWSGALPDQAFSFDGPAGVRSDNGVFDFDLRVPQPRHANAHCAGG